MADNCASTAEEIVSEMSLSLVKAELQRRGLPAKGKKPALMARLIVAIKQEESNPPSLQNESEESTHIGSKQALPADYVPAASTSQLSSSQSANHQLSNFQLLRRKEMILKMDINAVIQVILETSKSPSNNIIRMENRVQKLNGYMESCSKVREEIIALISDDEVAEEAQKWIDYQRVIDNALDIAQEYISRQAISKADEQTTSSSAEHKQSHLKLPKLELPKFDGDVLKFQNFWDQFEVAIHDNDNVPSVQKFTYLRSVLEGIAYHTIEGFEVTSANYQHAVDALKHRFGRKRIIISSLVKSIIQLPRSNEGVEFLRDLHDTLKNRIRALEALGEKPTTHSCILLPILETKLPPELSEKWELELTDTKEESVDLELFFKFLNKQVISKEAGKRNASMIGENGGTARGSGARDKDGAGARNTREKVFSAAALLASETNRRSYAACHVCKEQGHETFKCPELERKSVDKRWHVDINIDSRTEVWQNYDMSTNKHWYHQRSCLTV
ncbi:hypothetical protein AWC38_SpisGene18645 [Stylophora pistillata]|uniref:SAP domain-containing protein n=1 Tax=Stylophora pistillata TaxID=50429 RepID=A0A2B4RKN5_STYPI|nr:hypothetical protein AWC38_SpisGene18645 [Stylophora pistillata]